MEKLQKCISEHLAIERFIPISYELNKNTLQIIFNIKNPVDLVLLQEIFHLHSEYKSVFDCCLGKHCDEYPLDWMHEYPKAKISRDNTVEFVFTIFNKRGEFDNFKRFIKEYCEGKRGRH